MLVRFNTLGNGVFIAILILMISLTCFDVCGQKKLPEITLSIDVSQASVSQILDMISKQSGIPFSYNPKKIPANQKISYHATNKTLSATLQDLSAQLGIQSAFVEDQIILKPEKRKEQVTPLTVTFSGSVKDEKTGEALIGATVSIQELKTGVVTNAFGFFSITIPKGSYTISCSFIGYKPLQTSVELIASQQKDILLPEEPPVLREIVITSAIQDVVSEIQVGKINIRPVTVEERPALFGEMDVVKSLESVPGIKLHSDGSTFYYVRGGNRDQNMILVDDAPIYTPSHMLGVFSTVIPDVINDISLYKGDMPASLGGRLSSVLDVRTKKGNDQHTQAWGNASLISTKLGVEGPIKKNASSFLFATRISRLKWFFKLYDKNIQRFNFFDLTGKVNVRLNTSNRLYFSLYSGGDNYFNQNNGIQWNNTTASLKWNHIFHDRLFMNTTAALSGYDYFLYTDVAKNTRWNSHIANFNLKTDFSYFLNPESELTFGTGINAYGFNPGNLLSDTTLASVPVLSVKNAVEFVLYGNHEVKLDERWGINYGLRFSTWTDTGEAFEFKFDENGNPVDTMYYKKGVDYKKFVNAEPRVTVSYSLNESSSIKTSFAKNVQNVHLISNSISPFTSLDVWLPSSINIKPQKSRQFTLGYYRSDFLFGTSLSAETYFKKMVNQIDYNSHAQTLLNPMLESELRFGKATAYGLELMAKKDEGRVRGWVGYTYSRAKRHFKDINEGRTYNAFYDRPHQVNIMLTYDASLRWNLGMNWIYSTGSPFTSPLSFYTYNGEEVPIFGPKNNDRLPDYHRLDVSATYKLNKNPENRFTHTLSFSIFNAYGRKNVLFVNYNKKQVDDNTFRIPANLLDNERTTSQFYLFQFTPSISYNFKWL